MVTGPRLEKPAMVSVESVAPTVIAESAVPGGASIVEQDGPLLPAETGMNTPAARRLSIAMVRLFAVQVSPPGGGPSGQVYELPTASGRLDGSGLWPLRSVGARKNCRHSMYVVGLPTPSSMLWQEIHFAAGGTPIWVFPPPFPMPGPIVWGAWALLSPGGGGVEAPGVGPLPPMVSGGSL